jgi:hypothetical protein
VPCGDAEAFDAPCRRALSNSLEEDEDIVHYYGKDVEQSAES